jgi:hypothetical protein
LAEANARAALISGASESELYERTSQRVIAEETRKQICLEKATIEAARIASESTVERPNEIPDDWMEKWAEGAQTASSAQVRGLYSRILANKATSPSGGVSYPSVRLLRELDSDLADTLSKFAQFVMWHGCYPMHGFVNPNVIDSKKLALLTEIGFLMRSPRERFQFRDFALRFGGSRLISNYLHDNIDFTQRGADIANAVWGARDAAEKFGPPPGPSEAASIYSRLIMQALRNGPSPISLGFHCLTDIGEKELFVELSADGGGLNFERIAAEFQSAHADISPLRELILRAVAGTGRVSDVRTNTIIRPLETPHAEPSKASPRPPGG